MSASALSVTATGVVSIALLGSFLFSDFMKSIDNMTDAEVEEYLRAQGYDIPALNERISVFAKNLSERHGDKLDFIMAIRAHCAEVAEQVAYTLKESHGVTLTAEAEQHIARLQEVFIPELISLMRRHKRIPSA